MGFIKDVVRFENANWRWLLITSWVFFALAVASIVFSFMISQEAFLTQIKNTDDHVVDKVDLLSNTNQSAKRVKVLNIAAFLLWFVGVILTIVFVSVNTLH
jgi:hypothetical protein